eukprot:jgi/Picsp_1/5226/NSC_02589-R1_---NA---
MKFGTAAEGLGDGKACIPGQERNTEQGAKRFGRKVVDKGRRGKGEKEMGGSVVGSKSDWEEQVGIRQSGAPANKNVGYPPRHRIIQRMNWSVGGKQWHPSSRSFRGQAVLNRNNYFGGSSKYIAPKILNNERDRKRNMHGKKKRPMSFCDMLWEEREAGKQRQRSEVDTCREDGIIQQSREKDILQQRDENSNSEKMCVPVREAPKIVEEVGCVSPRGPPGGKTDVLGDEFPGITEKEVERQLDPQSLELDNGVDIIDLRDDSSTSDSPDVSSDVTEEISGVDDLTKTSDEDEDDDNELEQQQQSNEEEEEEKGRRKSGENSTTSWKPKKACFSNRQAQFGEVSGSFVGSQAVRGNAPSTRLAWLNAAMAWRQKNMPTESELRKRKDEASKRASEAAKMRNKSGTRFQEEMPESGQVMQPIKIPSKPDADASESEWKLYFKNFHAARIASASSFVQVLRAFNVTCKDPENIKGAYMQAVRMYHPDSNSKLRTWSTDREKAEAEEIMKLINQRKPHEFSI